MIAFATLSTPGWPIRCTRYKYNSSTTFPTESRLFSRLDPPRCLFGAPGSRDVFATLTPWVAFSVHQGKTYSPNDDFSQEVEMFSLLYPPRGLFVCTRYEYSLNDDFLRGRRDVFATLSTWVGAYSVH
ncbi:unnamed protein product [Trichogramma brassicae]|uniref:Uncharacterized protein n=1 Tax=Trichogramma brassicae TaxID=86971 RepID=A0A6H5I3P4_9HYME|nr:unnamed protein product [Trichogramma brassicae]